MPIESIIAQPDANGIAAAYRPVIIRVSATNTDTTPNPPVVYCDIYFNDVFYKTISKTQRTLLNGAETEWEFDIQDAAQEYLLKLLGEFAEPAIVEAVAILTKCQCKFRSSGYDANGFIETEDTAPVQGTGSSDPVSGTGTASNTFYIINSTLQHDDNQDLLTHLSYFRKRNWSADTYPLSHRPDDYKVGPNSSDIFPILFTGTLPPSKIRVKYRLCGQTTFHDTDPIVPICNVPVVPEGASLPDGNVGVPYSAQFTLTGTPPFTLINVVKPGWMVIAVVGSTIYFTGDPEIEAPLFQAFDISFDIDNCHEDLAHFEDSIIISA